MSKHSRPQGSILPGAPASLPRVAVLLPYRDAASTVEEALDSVLAQQGVEVEVIAVDDGSRDDGPVRVGRIAARHRGLRVLKTGGIGIAGALQTALGATTTEWIGRMDADDRSRPDRFRCQLEALRADPRLAVVGTRVEAFPGTAVGPGLRRYLAWQNGLTTAREHAEALFIESVLCHPSTLLRREALTAVGGWRDVAWPEDYDLWLRLDGAGWRMAKVPRVLFDWRHGQGRVTFSDPRCAPERFLEAKVPHLVRRFHQLGRPLVIWGAGPTGRRLARALRSQGLVPLAFIDVDPRKLGRLVQGAPVQPPEALVPSAVVVIVAVGAWGAREEIRNYLQGAGAREGDDFLCAA